MEFVLVDKDGRSREYFATRSEAIEALQDEEQASAGITAGWMLLAFNKAGDEVGDPEWSEDLLRSAEASVTPSLAPDEDYLPSFSSALDGILSLASVKEAWSEIWHTTQAGSLRRYVIASGIPAQDSKETAVG